MPDADSQSLKLKYDKKQAERVNAGSRLLFVSFEEYSNFRKVIWGLAIYLRKLTWSVLNSG